MSSNTFTLLTPPHIQSVQLLGSWDNYTAKLEMAQSKSTPGTWRLNIKFPETSAGNSKRYWYYFILDGYFESFNPNKPTTKEPTRGITLNILDILRSGASSPVSPTEAPAAQYAGEYTPTAPHMKNTRPPSHIQIVAPKPRNPMHAHKLTIDTDYARPYSTYSDVATISSHSPASSCGSLSDCESPVTPIDDFSDDESFAINKKRHGYYDLAAEMGGLKIVS
jgi:hypothetical protein